MVPLYHARTGAQKLFYIFLFNCWYTSLFIHIRVLCALFRGTSWLNIWWENSSVTIGILRWLNMRVARDSIYWIRVLYDGGQRWWRLVLYGDLGLHREGVVIHYFCSLGFYGACAFRNSGPDIFPIYCGAFIQYYRFNIRIGFYFKTWGVGQTVKQY